MPPISTPRRSPRKARALSVSTFPCSSDTECSPPKKRSRHEERPRKRSDRDLVDILYHLFFNPSDINALHDLRTTSNKDQDVAHAMQRIIDEVKSTVKRNIAKDGRKVLQVELYLRWLRGLEFIVTTIESALGVKKFGTRRRILGLGRLSFATLYYLVDGFIEEVNAHQDGWSFRSPAGPIEVNPLVMTLAEEANDPSTDCRSEKAVRAAEEIFARIDTVFLAALRRYKIECDKQLMASSIARKEESLSKGCCLLSEQTGFGATDDMGFDLLVQSREAMLLWKHQVEDR